MFKRQPQGALTNAPNTRYPYLGGTILALSALMFIHYAWLISSPHELLVCFIPDDAFYELEIARHFLTTGRWSFDGGFSTTTGFHLFNVYLMSTFPTLFDRPWLAIYVWMAVGLALSIFTIRVLCEFAVREFGAFSLTFVALVLTAPSFTTQSTAVMEYPFVISTAAAYVWTLWRAFEQPERAGWFSIFSVGFLGSLVRSDFGGLPFAICIAAATCLLWNRSTRVFIPSLYGLCGAAVGLAFVFLHNYFFSGHLLSGSVMAKALWGQRSGYSITLPLLTSVGALTWSYGLLLRAVSVLLLVLIVRAGATALNHLRNPDGLAFATSLNKDSEKFLLGFSGLLAIAIYCVVYGADPATQLWYSGNFVLPFVLVFGTISGWIAKDPVRRATSFAVIGILIVVNIKQAYKPVFPHQRYMLEMSDYVSRSHLNGRLAGWNVGIVGYFLDGRAINLDGLMNDQIYPYMRDHKVSEYLNDSRIDYIVDFPSQIVNPVLAKERGYDGESLFVQLKPVHTVPNLNRRDLWLDYTLFRRETGSASKGDR